MSQPRRRQGQSRRRHGARPAPRAVDLWRPVPPLPETEPIVASSDPAALLRSLGDPPLQGQGAAAGHYLAAVVERAAGLALALAATGGLLAEADEA
jgi:hypothetical protein